jgi:hypothetical protein
MDATTPNRTRWPRIVLTVPPEARDTLHALARSHYRDPKREALRILLDGLERERLADKAADR